MFHKMNPSFYTSEFRIQLRDKVCLQDVSGEGTANGHKGLLGNEETVRTSLGVPVKRNSYQRQSSVSDQDTVETYIKQDSNLNTAIKQQMHKPQANVSLMRLLKLNRPEWKEGLLGFLGAIGFGFTNPFFAFIVALLTSDYYADLSHDELWHKVKTYISFLVAIFVFFLTTNIVQHYYFAVAGEYLTKRTREHMLSSILSFEVGWFDRDANSSGSVCSRLASDANMVRALIGDRISLVTGSLSMVVVSWVICFIVSWRFGVLVIFLHPLIIFCYYIKKVCPVMGNSVLSWVFQRRVQSPKGITWVNGM
jgi:ATP-binding cassette subfamily B (MDR/TAP) protein 1